MHKYKFKAAYLPDCERNRLYVTWCEIHGMVGISASTMEELAYKVELGADELIELRANKRPSKPSHRGTEKSIELSEGASPSLGANKRPLPTKET